LILIRTAPASVPGAPHSFLQCPDPSGAAAIDQDQCRERRDIPTCGCSTLKGVNLVNTYKISDADLRPHLLNKEETVRMLLKKAEEFINAVFLETGAKFDTAKRQEIEMALLEDFIEVHNYALNHHIPLPDAKFKVDELVRAKHAGHDIR
jgi:hypothetical protein